MRKDQKVPSFFKMLLVLILATGVSLLITRLGISKESVLMVYLLGILFVTILTNGYGYALIACVISVFLFNYFFTEPLYTFFIYRLSDFVLLMFFLITALVSGTVTSRLQEQMSRAHESKEAARLLYEVAGGFLHITGKRNLVLRAIGYIYDNTGCVCRVALNDEEVAYCDVHYPPPPGFPEERRLIPLPGAAQELGTIEVTGEIKKLTEHQNLILDTVATQLGLALDREYAYMERENIRIDMEREQMRSMLLRSVAHDLRSPLTALTGASSLLADEMDSLSPEQQKKLARDISEEMVWLANLVENILNMTRISEGRLVLHREDEVVDDIVNEAVSHMSRLLVGRTFQVSLPSEVVSLPMDGKLVAQVLINLIDNAVKHTPLDAQIDLRVETKDGFAVFEVADTGTGIDPSIAATLFDRFVTLERASGDAKHGMGLGLAICRAVVEGHGGTICAKNRPNGGALFRFTLPLTPEKNLGEQNHGIENFDH